MNEPVDVPVLRGLSGVLLVGGGLAFAGGLRQAVRTMSVPGFTGM